MRRLPQGHHQLRPGVAVRSKQFVHGETGFLVDQSLSVSEIAQYVLAVIQSQGVTQAMRRQAKEHAREFTWRRYAQQVRDNFMAAKANAS